LRRIALIRHGPTDWNAAGRIQGHTDSELSTHGRDTVSRWRIPAELRNYDWHASPLKRALQTAQLLSGGTPTVTAALKEMHWGEWEGKLLTDLRKQLGAEFTENEARGLDFHPPGGETPRAVRARFAKWVTTVTKARQYVLGVTHKGVIRAALSLATGWDMRGAPPDKLRWDCAHMFRIGADGGFCVEYLNISLSATNHVGSATRTDVV